MKETSKRVIYYVGFGLAVFSRTLEASALFEIPDEVFDFIELLVAILFLIKYVFDKHNLKELTINLAIISLLLILKVYGLPMSAIIFYLAFISFQGVDVRNIIKIDLVIKVFFLVTHLFIFSLDLLLDQQIALAAFSEHAKGIANSLYFKNPNTTGFIGVWAILDYLMLKRVKRIRDYIVPSIAVGIIYVISLSRSAVFVYVLYVALHAVRNQKILYILSKITYPLLFIASLYIVTSLTMDNQTVSIINSLLSNRLSYSIAIFRAVGINFLPITLPSWISDLYVVDNFYVRCITYYGLVTAILYIIPHLLLKNSSRDNSKIMGIVSATYLFIESATASIGLCPAYLIMADSIFNDATNEKEIKNEKSK